MNRKTHIPREFTSVLYAIISYTGTGMDRCAVNLGQLNAIGSYGTTPLGGRGTWSSLFALANGYPEVNGAN